MVNISLNSYSDGNKYKEEDYSKIKFSGGFFETANGKRLAYINSNLNSANDSYIINQLSQINKPNNSTNLVGLLRDDDNGAKIDNNEAPDSLFNYVEPLKQGIITSEQIGKFHNLSLDYVMNYR